MKLPTFSAFEREFKNEIWHDAARIICRRHDLSFNSLMRAEHGSSIVFLLDESLVVKIYYPTRNALEREMVSLETAHSVRGHLTIPEIVACGELEGYDYMVMTQIKGDLMTRSDWLKLEKKEQISILRELAEGLRELHRSDASRIDFDWENFIDHQAATCFERQKACRVNERVLSEIPSFLEENLNLLPRGGAQVFLHGDVHFGNLRLERKNGILRISGLFDFAESLKGFHEYEFLAVCVLMIQGQGELQREFFRAFGYAEAEIDEELRRRLMLLTMFYECSDLRRYAVRLRPEAVEYSLDKLMREIWNFV